MCPTVRDFFARRSQFDAGILGVFQGDTSTGVQYLFVHSGYAGGLCPLLDKDGKPLTWET
ncbi:MAG: hypothetical protein HFF29_01950 [Oscillospiraceae bacterium]|nr:hypothetical protein [Oscillospiraceae bacterium]